MLRPGDRVVVAVSGGPDSTALLTLFRRAARRLGVELHVAHLDHGWRGRGAARDAEFVRRLALRMGLSVTIGHAEDRVAPAPGRRQSSREAIGRALRMRFLQETAAAVGAARVALGHTLDDQAESLLMRLLRGSGTRGLAGTYPVVDGLFIRPLLGVRRSEIVRYLKTRRQAYRVDPTNRDTSLTRNRVRRRLMPLLEREFNPAAAEVLARCADLLRDEEAWMNGLAQAAFRAAATPGPGGVSLATAALLAMPRALARRVLRRAVEEVRGHLHGLDFRHVEEMERLLENPGMAALDLPGGVRVVQRPGALRLESPAPGRVRERPTDRSAARSMRAMGPGEDGVAGCREAVCPIPGSVDLPGLGLALHARVVRPEDPAAAPGPDRACLDADLLPGPLLVRPRRPGDRFVPLGGPGTRKVKSFLIDRKVPVAERGRIPLVLENGRIAWIVGHRIDDRFKVTPATRRILVLEKETR
ncbi:MAG TPA: tRNA lysidine(34) synthetase TilS [Patescibacteria group bacterium]|nr:tRNA lysidine(34) synthetase TilS [Patescibacteria group bacterium]